MIVSTLCKHHHNFGSLILPYLSSQIYNSLPPFPFCDWNKAQIGKPYFKQLELQDLCPDQMNCQALDKFSTNKFNMLTI